MDALAHQATCYPRPSKATFDLGAQASQPVHEALSVPGDSGKPKLSEGETGTYLHHMCCLCAAKSVFGHGCLNFMLRQ